MEHGTPDDFTNTGSANVILVVPPETLIGDLILVGAMDAFSGSCSVAVTGTGFTQVDNATDTAGDLAALVAYKFAVASDVQTGLGGSAGSPVSYSFPTGGSHKALGWMECITGVNATTPINAQSSFTAVNSGTTSQTYPSLTSTVDNTLFFAYGFWRNGVSGKTDNATTTPSGWTEQADLQTNAGASNNGAMQVLMQTKVTAGTISGPAVTLQNSSKALMKVIALTPA